MKDPEDQAPFVQIQLHSLLPNDPLLELGEHAYHLKHRLARQARCTEPLLTQQQADSFVVQSLEYAEQVGLGGKHRRGVLSPPSPNGIEPRRVPFDEPPTEEPNMQPKPFVWIADPIKLSPPGAERIKC